MPTTINSVVISKKRNPNMKIFYQIKNKSKPLMIKDLFFAWLCVFVENYAIKYCKTRSYKKVFL
ncbi:hypothetical protein Cs308_0183 [Candidatus Chlamydia sanziniae]|uniref:Uncharacterized protein n=1 Tax=Candidatus Chlamydia sanziniae TaxID=1806891 RepID=A0A1A9HWD0_9CHLA|nr:hypothetical protein Cs308_0183 [Candidatus Chlamydia sanziniae]